MEEKFHVRKIWIDVHPSNSRAIKAYEKANFHFSQEIIDSKGVKYNRLVRNNAFL